jgi:hypothetical protein
VAFKQGSPPYREGLRDGVVICTDMTFREYLENEGPRGGWPALAIPPEILARLCADLLRMVPADVLDRVTAIVRISPTRELPVGAFVAAHPDYLEVLEESGPYSAN